MAFALKKLFLVVCICCKPPVFLTISIIAVVAYLTLIVSEGKNKVLPGLWNLFALKLCART